MKRPTPLSRQCGTGQRRRKPRKAERRCEEIHPAWLIKQAQEAKKRLPVSSGQS